MALFEPAMPVTENYCEFDTSCRISDALAYSASKNTKFLSYIHSLIKAYDKSGTWVNMQFDREISRLLVTCNFDARSMEYSEPEKSNFTPNLLQRENHRVRVVEWLHSTISKV